MTWEFIQGKDKEGVINTVYPIIKAHFKDPNKSQETFNEMLEKAIGLYKIYQSGGDFKI